jgi:hypothetical protein
VKWTSKPQKTQNFSASIPHFPAETAFSSKFFYNTDVVRGFISLIFRNEILYAKYVDLLDKLKEVEKSSFFSTVYKVVLSVICGYPHLKQLFRRHKKQFNDFFLELDSKWMIVICSNTRFSTRIVPKTTQDMQLNERILKCFFPIVIIGYLFLSKTFKTFNICFELLIKNGALIMCLVRIKLEIRL